MSLVQKFKAWREARRLVRESVAFNSDQMKTQFYRYWKCPACGKITEGHDHEYRVFSGMNFPGCCDRMKLYGPRSFSFPTQSLDSDYVRLILKNHPPQSIKP